MWIQQGDVKLKKIYSLPKDVAIIPSDIIHKGLNHTHRIKGNFDIYIEKQTGHVPNGTPDAQIYVDVKSPCTLEHDEHGLCEEEFRTLPIGIWKKSIINEYSHFLEESKKVID